MDVFPRMSRLERDLTVIAATAVAVASAIGGLIGWAGHQLFVHLHHEGISDHGRRA